jgi:hypothetical protein
MIEMGPDVQHDSTTVDGCQAELEITGGCCGIATNLYLFLSNDRLHNHSVKIFRVGVPHEPSTFAITNSTLTARKPLPIGRLKIRTKNAMSGGFETNGP